MGGVPAMSNLCWRPLETEQKPKVPKPRPSVRRVIKKLKELTPAMEAAIDADTKVNYFDNTVIRHESAAGEEVAIRTDDIFRRRGHDNSRSTPSVFQEDQKAECIVAIRGRERVESSDGAVGVAAAPTATYLGAPFANKDNKRKHQTGKKPIPARPLHIIKLGVNLDSQTPNIQLTTRLEGSEKDKSASEGVVFTRFYAQDLRLRDDYTAGVIFRPYLETNDHDLPAGIEADEQNPGTVSTTTLLKMHEKGRLFELTLLLNPERPAQIWTGIRQSEVEAIRQRAPGVKTEVRDRLIQGIDKADAIHIYLDCESKNGIQNLAAMADYASRIFTMSMTFGNFWFYRGQLLSAGMDPNLIEGTELPKFNFEIPRWMVTSYELDEEEDGNGSFKYSHTRPYTWCSHRYFTEYPNANEAAFLLKLGVDGEQKWQSRALAELVQSRSRIFFRGSFRALEGLPGAYIVQITMEDDANIISRGLRIPSAGTRIMLKVDPNDPDFPNPARMASFRGSVCQDLFEEGATFVCLVHGPPEVFTSRDPLAFDVPYPIYIGYLIDDLPHARQMRAIEELQVIDSTNKPAGVDLKALFFHDSAPAPDTGIMARNFTASVSTDASGLTTKFDDFRKDIDGLPKKAKANKVQAEAIVNTAQSPTGLTVVQGPPGCGKTMAIKLIGLAHLRQGHKVMYCTPQNQTILNIYDSFEKFVKSDNRRFTFLQNHEYVHFTGAFSKIVDSERLMVKQKLMAKYNELSDEDADSQATELMNVDNLLIQYARLSITQAGVATDIKWTFGAKLLARIQLWASQDGTEAHQAHARKYLELTEQLPFCMTKDRREFLEIIGDYEYALCAYYLRHDVKVVFCTLSTSAHPLLHKFFEFEELIIDESPDESIGGMATVCEAFKHCIQHITLAGDHLQGKTNFAAKERNIGHAMLSRNLFQEICEDPRKIHAVYQLKENYRMHPELFEFTAQFYKDAMTCHQTNSTMEVMLRRTLKAYWASRLRENFRGSPLQVAIDVNSEGHAQAEGSTSRFNTAEAECIAWTIHDQLCFPAPERGRALTPEDIGIITPYTAQVLEIKKCLRKKGINDNRILVATTNHAKGKERLVTYFSIVINSGVPRLTSKDHIPIGFVAADHNINVSLSRGRIGRYIFGGLQCLAQAKRDRLPTSYRYAKFFNHIQYLVEKDCIVSDREWRYVIENPGERPDPNNEDGFAAQLYPR